MVRRAMGAEGWTAAEELALADHAKRMGLGAWEELSEMVRETLQTDWHRCIRERIYIPVFPS